MAKIKLLKIEEYEAEGVKIIRLQSQLLINKNVADFVLENGVLKHYEKGDKGFQFYETNIEYEIVQNIKEMQYQQL